MKFLKKSAVQAYFVVDESGLFIFKSHNLQHPEDHMDSEAPWHLPLGLSGPIHVFINLPEPTFETLSPPKSLSWWDSVHWLLHQRKAYRENQLLLGYKRLPESRDWLVALSPATPILTKLMEFLEIHTLKVQAFYLLNLEKLAFIRHVHASVFSKPSPILLWVEDHGRKRLTHTVMFQGRHILTRFITASTPHDNANHIAQTLTYARRHSANAEPDCLYISQSHPSSASLGRPFETLTPHHLYTLITKTVSAFPSLPEDDNTSEEVTESYTSFLTWFYRSSPLPQGLALSPCLQVQRKFPWHIVGWVACGCATSVMAVSSYQAWSVYTHRLYIQEEEKKFQHTLKRYSTTSQGKIFQEAAAESLPPQAQPEYLMHLFSQALPQGLFLKSWQWQIISKACSLTFICCVDPAFQDQEPMLCATFLNSLLALFPGSYFSKLDSPHSIYHTGSWHQDFTTLGTFHEANFPHESSWIARAPIIAQGTLVCPFRA